MSLADEWFTEFIQNLEADRDRVRAAKRELVEPIAVTLKRRRVQQIEEWRVLLHAT